MARLTNFIIYIRLLVPIVCGQECTDTVGSLNHDNNLVALGQTFILADYMVPCSGTVVAWEFCYQILGVPSVTFYPGIWRITATSGVNTDYALVQSNTVTYDSSVRNPQDPSNNFPCQMFNLSDTDQFTAPAGSVVGLYSGIQFTQLLHTNTNSSITTYQFSGNQSNISTAAINDDVNYNIAIRVHLVVSGQECTDTVTIGSLNHDNNVVAADRTFILADYTIPCSGTVVAWEFCCQILGVSSVTFHPGIWRINGTSGSNTDYALAQSNTVTYDPSLRDPQNSTNNFPCQTFNLSDTDQFIAPAGSVVGLYSGILFTQLLHTNADSSITTYQFSGNQSSVKAGNNNVNYNIAIRVHLVPTGSNGTVTSTTITTSTVSTSDSTTALIASASDAITVTPTTSMVSNSDTTLVTSTVLIVSTSDTSTATPTISVVPGDIVTAVMSATPTSSAIPANDSESSSDSCAIIGGAMGGVILLLMIIIMLLCIAMVCMRRSHNKKAFSLSSTNYNAAKLNTQVMVESNPSYDVTKADYSYNKQGDSDVPTTVNPPYGVSTKPYSGTNEDNYNYVQPKEPSEYLDLEDTIKMKTNPSYGVATGDRTAALNVPDTKANHSSHNAAIKDYDYAYTQDDHLLHHNMANNTSGDGKEESRAIEDQNNHTYVP